MKDSDLIIEMARAMTETSDPEPRWIRKAQRALEVVRTSDDRKKIFRYMNCPKCLHRWKSEILLRREPRNFGTILCTICGSITKKKHPRQNVCDNPVCVRKRNSQNHRKWRKTR